MAKICDSMKYEISVENLSDQWSNYDRQYFYHIRCTIYVLPSLFFKSLFSSAHNSSKPLKFNCYRLSSKMLNIRCPKLKMSDFQEEL